MRLDKGLLGALRRIRGIDVRENVPLYPYTTFKIGGPARIWIVPRGIAPLEKVLRVLNGFGVSYHMLGGGSNVLISDQGLQCVVSTRQLQWIRPVEDDLLEVGGGASLRRLVSYTIRKGFSGLEHLCGIPGSLGGAIVMNAGGRSGTIKDVLESVFIVRDTGGEWIPSSRIEFTYRGVRFPGDIGESGPVVAAARIKCVRSRPGPLKQRVRAMMKRRHQSQPIGARSAGCVFKNPRDAHAGMLIEASGLKGMGVGGAQVSERHANFIINSKGASAQDVLELMKRVRDMVFKDHGVLLEPEVKLVGMEL